jgi:hypothetical protein
MGANAPNGFLVVFGVAVALASAAVVLLQNLGKTTVRDDHDLPPVASRFAEAIERMRR